MKRRSTALARSAALAGYAELVRELGGEPEKLLRAVGIDARALEDPDRLVSYVAFIDLLELTAARTECPEFGLRLSQRQGLTTLGPVGLLARQERDVRSAFAVLLRHLHLHAEGLLVTMKEEDGMAVVTLNLAIPGLRSTRQIEELSVGMGLNVIRVLLGKRWAPESVYFAHAPAAKREVYRRLLAAPVHFDWEFTGYTFPAALLHLAVPDVDDDLHRYLLRYVEGLEARHSDDLLSKTRALLGNLVSTRRCSLPVVARYLGLDARTLQRRLHDEGIGFRELIDEVRLALAERHLAESQKSLTQIAELIGYSELSAFTRSFRRRHRQSPSAWRAAHATRRQGR